MRSKSFFGKRLSQIRTKTRIAGICPCLTAGKECDKIIGTSGKGEGGKEKQSFSLLGAFGEAKKVRTEGCTKERYVSERGKGWPQLYG